MIPKILFFPEDIHKEVNSNFSKNFENFSKYSNFRGLSNVSGVPFFRFFRTEDRCVEIDRVETANI